MGNRYPISTIYFCGNCEDEVVGLPAGSRIASGRPLCLRCAQIGEEEGWGMSNIPTLDTCVYEPTRKRGIILLLVMMALTSVAVLFLTALSGSKSRY